MTRHSLLAYLMAASLVSAPTQAQEVATFHCSFKGVFETLWNEAPVRSTYFEAMFVGRRLDVTITREPTATVSSDVSSPGPFDWSGYVVINRPPPPNSPPRVGGYPADWVLLQTKVAGDPSMIRIRPWDDIVSHPKSDPAKPDWPTKPDRFTFQSGGVLAFGTCYKVK